MVRNLCELRTVLFKTIISKFIPLEFLRCGLNDRIEGLRQSAVIPPDGLPFPASHPLAVVAFVVPPAHQFSLKLFLVAKYFRKPLVLRPQPRDAPSARQLVLVLPQRLQLPRLRIPLQAELELGLVVVVAAVLVVVGGIELPILGMVLHEPEVREQVRRAAVAERVARFLVDVAALVASIVAVEDLLPRRDPRRGHEAEGIPRRVRLEGAGVQPPGVVAVVGHVVHGDHERVLVPTRGQPERGPSDLVVLVGGAPLDPRLLERLPPRLLVGRELAATQHLRQELLPGGRPLPGHDPAGLRQQVSDVGRPPAPFAQPQLLRQVVDRPAAEELPPLVVLRVGVYQVAPRYLGDDVALFDGVAVRGDEEAEDGRRVARTLAADAEGRVDVALGVRFYPFDEIRAVVVAMFVGRKGRRSRSGDAEEGEEDAKSRPRPHITTTTPRRFQC
mmetsp:Transcript_33091/g.70534  ORF Transcript_33091/g.70534 Transcript_33091/m.70534 type:complete len:445 (-) Transcript_33091:115-1449(-)